MDSADGLVEVDPTGVKKQDVGVAGSSGRDIALGSDGRVWWADFGGASIRATPTTGLMPTTEAFAVGGGPQAVGAGPAGQLAYGNPGTDPQTVGRITTSGNFTTTKTPASDPFGVAFGADGAYWLPLFAMNKLGRLTTGGGYTTPISFAANSGPRKIAAGVAGTTLWVSLETSKKIARITGVQPPSGGGGGGGGGDTTAPEIASPRFRSNHVTEGRQTKLIYKLSEGAGITVRIERVIPGRVRKGSCVKPTPKLAKAKKCKRYARVQTVVRKADAGTNSITFDGGLAVALYRYAITARDAAGNVSTERHAKLRVVRKPSGR